MNNSIPDCSVKRTFSETDKCLSQLKIKLKLNASLKSVLVFEDDIGDYSALRSNLNEFIISLRWNRTRDLVRDSLKRYRLSYHGHSMILSFLRKIIRSIVGSLREMNNSIPDCSVKRTFSETDKCLSQ